MSDSERITQNFAKLMREAICSRLQISNFAFAEIESKRRISPRQVKSLKKYMRGRKKVHHIKTTFSMDQFLDTPERDLFKKGASLRLRYKRNGTDVYLQYKGPGFLDQGLLYRSEFTTERMKRVVLEESHHDIIRFSQTSAGTLLNRHAAPVMIQAMRRHLGRDVLNRLLAAPIICSYQKEKYMVDLGSAFLEPSIDRVFAFHVGPSGPHAVSSFWEYENEIKAELPGSLAKITHLPELLEFEEKVAREFSLKPEPLDKYHRCATILMSHRKRGR